jgi:hypothetical protein
MYSTTEQTQKRMLIFFGTSEDEVGGAMVLDKGRDKPRDQMLASPLHIGCRLIDAV